MIKYYHFGSVWGLPDASPFCVKLETFMRMSGIPFEAFRGQKHLRNSPKGKMPYIEDDGVKIGDSSLIIRHLNQKYGDKLDEHLNDEQRHQTILIQRTLEDHFYWAMVYCRWLDPNNALATRDTFFRKMPMPMRVLVFKYLTSQLRKNLQAQGLGRHTPEEIYALAIEDAAAVVAPLKDQPYLLGDQPSSVDATAYGFLLNLVAPPTISPVRDFVVTQPGVKEYVERIKTRFFEG